MRKYLFALLVLGMACSGLAGEEKRLKLLFRDYRLTDEDVRPISIGAVLWQSKELPDHFGPYAGLSPFYYKNLRFEAGCASTWNEKRSRVEIAMLTGISVRIKEKFILGAWYEPFWGMDKRFPDDAWGVMVGYAFRTP